MAPGVGILREASELRELSDGATSDGCLTVVAKLRDRIRQLIPTAVVLLARSANVATAKLVKAECI
jgi:hypothetical protein